ncbi:hypothetical protein SNEBB_009335 [Seison nebaliae]|nr:hypothetical protein SNEBB_009335 [Seison nebaliae]
MILKIVVCQEELLSINIEAIASFIKGVKENKEKNMNYPEMNLCFPTIPPSHWKQFHSDIAAEQELKYPTKFFDPLGKIYENTSNITFSAFEYELALPFMLHVTDMLCAATDNRIPRGHAVVEDVLLNKMLSKSDEYKVYFRKRFLIFFGRQVGPADIKHYAKQRTHHMCSKVIGKFLLNAATELGENNEQLIQNDVKEWTIRTPKVAIQHDFVSCGYYSALNVKYFSSRILTSFRNREVKQLTMMLIYELKRNISFNLLVDDTPDKIQLEIKFELTTSFNAKVT